MKNSESLFTGFLDGREIPPGYPSCARAKLHLSKYILANRDTRPALVVAYPEKYADGTRSEYYDWSTGEWKKSPLDYRGAYFMARHEARSGDERFGI